MRKSGAPIIQTAADVEALLSRLKGEAVQAEAEEEDDEEEDDNAWYDEEEEEEEAIPEF